MNAIEAFAWKITKEYKRAKNESRPMNFREVAGSFLAQFDIPEAADASAKACETSPDPIMIEATALLKKLVVRLANVTAPRLAGTAQVSVPSPAAAQGGAQV